MSHDMNSPFQGEILVPLRKYFQPSPTKKSSRGPTNGMMVRVDRGLFTKYSLIGSFQISRFETTKKEWRRVFWWAIENGYKFNRGKAEGDEHPITNVSMYDCMAWCNAKSEMENLNPCYFYDEVVLRESDLPDYKFAESVIDWNRNASGYRIPDISEWVWAAGGGSANSKSKYAGSDELESVAWFEFNSEGHSMPVGKKLPNEIGLHDMSGNVWEWVWCGGSLVSPCMGGCWSSSRQECEFNTLSGYKPQAYYASDEIGFRYARSLDYFEHVTIDIDDLNEEDVQKIIQSIESQR